LGSVSEATDSRQAPRPDAARIIERIRRIRATAAPVLSNPDCPKVPRAVQAPTEAQRPAAGPEAVSGGAVGAAPEAPLGNTTENASAPGQGGNLGYRRRLRRVLWRISPGSRWGKCGRVLAGGGSVLVRKVGGASRYANLMTCGSIHCCPMCQATLRSHKADEVSRLAAWWLDQGHGLVMVTLTLPHSAGMPLKGLWSVVSEGLRFTRSGRPYQRFKMSVGILHSVRALEVTHGGNGWHPHVHLLLLLDIPPGAGEIAQVKVYFNHRWGGWVRKQGYGEIHPIHGVDVLPIYTRADAMGAYIAKLQEGWSVGAEMVRGDAKRGRRNDGDISAHRTPLQILDDYGESGRPEDLALWREWEDAAPGHQAIVMSDGLRELVGLAAEPTDEELAQQLEAGDTSIEVSEDVALIDYASTWKAMVATGTLYERVLAASDAGGLRGINEVLAAAGLPLAAPAPPRPPP
jgi:hypothetical protein